MDMFTIYENSRTILSYLEFRWFFSIVFSVTCLSSMIINNLTGRKWLSLIVLTIIGTVLFTLALQLLEDTIPRVIVDQHIYSMFFIFCITLILAYTSARIGIMVSVHPRKQIATLLANFLSFLSNRASATAENLSLHSQNLKEYATIPAVERGNALVRRAHEMRAKMID